MFGICQSESGGGGGEFCAGGAAVPDDPLAVATFAAAIVLCSMFWLDEVEFDWTACCDWEDTPAAAAAAAATANADKSFLFFLLRFRDVVVPIASTHITCCVWFFCVLLNLQAGVFFCCFCEIATQFPYKKRRQNEQKKKTKQNIQVQNTTK